MVAYNTEKGTTGGLLDSIVPLETGPTVAGEPGPVEQPKTLTPPQPITEPPLANNTVGVGGVGKLPSTNTGQSDTFGGGAKGKRDGFTWGEDYLNPEKSTVQGQLKGLLEGADSNPLVQKEKSQALQRMNARGLVNSSMAEDATTSAMMNYLTPIAMQDAQTHQAFNMLDAQYDMQKDFVNIQQAFDKMALEKNLSADEKQMMTSTFGSIFSNLIANVSRLMVDTDLTPQGKRNSVEELYGYFKEWVSTLSDLNEYDLTW